MFTVSPLIWTLINCFFLFPWQPDKQIGPESGDACYHPLSSWSGRVGSRVVRRPAARTCERSKWRNSVSLRRCCRWELSWYCVDIATTTKQTNNIAVLDLADWPHISLSLSLSLSLSSSCVRNNLSSFNLHPVCDTSVFDLGLSVYGRDCSCKICEKNKLGNFKRQWREKVSLALRLWCHHDLSRAVAR